MKKSSKPYTLTMSGRLVGFYKTLQEAKETAKTINMNRLKSGGPECIDTIKITYEQRNEPSRTVYEE